jgi:hypothetical protein
MTFRLCYLLITYTDLIAAILNSSQISLYPVTRGLY